MPRYKMLDGIEIQLTSEEEASRDAEEAQAIKEAKEYKKIAYKDKRKLAYPEIGEQLDKIYHEGLDAWKAEVKKTKDKYPKP